MHQINVPELCQLTVIYSLVSVSPGPEVIKLFSCSTQLSIKFKVLIYTKIAQIILKLKV